MVNQPLINEKLVGRRVLAVDDNPDTAMILRMILPADHHEVQVAHTGKRALELAESFRPQTALLDIGLPDMDGYELGRQLREKNPEIVLIAISGWGRDEDLQRSKEAGFDHHLLKPVDIETVRSMLRTTVHTV